MDDYIIRDGELYHYGVPGMKWGVRKSVYKSMTKGQRKAAKKQYLSTPEGKVKRATTIGTLLGGPLVGVIAGLATNKKVGGISEGVGAKGKTAVDRNADKKVSELSTKTESKKVADIKSRVTGKKENGKPAFLMNEQELKDFSDQYERRKSSLASQYKNAKDSASKKRIVEKMDRLENDYLNVVEQDFWYLDD